MEKKYICVVILFVGLCHGVSRALECTARGRFPNDETDDCRGYTMCLMGGLTNFTQYKLTCPMGSVYSHLEEQCTNATNYKCFPTFNCTNVGNFAIPESDCSSFVTCIEGLGSVGTARLIVCPPNMLFNYIAGTCVNGTEFICPAHKTTIEDHELHSNNALDIHMTFSLLFSAFLLLSML